MANHIVQLGPYPPPEGGVSRNMIAIRDALRAQGDKCSIVVTVAGEATGEESDVRRPDSPFGLLRLLWSMRFDVLHLHIGGTVPIRVLALAFACTVLGRGRAVLTMHSGAFPQTPEAIAARPGTLSGFVFRRFARIIAVNESIAEVFRRYGVADDRIRVILPFALKSPDPGVTVPGELKAFSTAHSPLLLSVGGLEPDYDPMFQVGAMKGVLVEFPSAGLMIVGDGTMRKQVETAISESGYADRIYLAGNVEHPVTLHLIKDAAVLIRTTLFDGDAISVREALHLGTPVVATDNGMRPAGVTLYEPSDREAFAKTIKNSMENPPASGDPEEPDDSNTLQVIKLYNELI